MTEARIVTQHNAKTSPQKLHIYDDILWWLTEHEQLSFSFKETVLFAVIKDFVRKMTPILKYNAISTNVLLCIIIIIKGASHICSKYKGGCISYYFCMILAWKIQTCFVPSTKIHCVHRWVLQSASSCTLSVPKVVARARWAAGWGKGTTAGQGRGRLRQSYRRVCYVCAHCSVVLGYMCYHDQRIKTINMPLHPLCYCVSRTYIYKWLSNTECTETFEIVRDLVE